VTFWIILGTCCPIVSNSVKPTAEALPNRIPSKGSQQAEEIAPQVFVQLLTSIEIVPQSNYW